MQTTLGAANDAVGLPVDTWTMENFTVEQYNELFAKLKDGSITVDNDMPEMPESTAHVTIK